MRTLTAALAIALAAVPARAAIVTRDVDYDQGGAKLRGYLAYDDARTAQGKQPGVLVVHEWWGLNDYVKGRAVMLAKLGYVAFALDMYGRGVLATDPKAAGELAGQFRGKPLMAERAQAGLDQLLATGLVDPARVAAIGYCFGGSTVQALAYSGAPLAGIVSFHGGLIPAGADAVARNRAKILICHGAIDPSVNPEQLTAYLKSLNEAKFDYRFVQYAGALHAFTNPGADALAEANPGMKGFIGYSPSADRRSWEDMKAFFDEIFAPARG
ncbi:MAG: dienelactone hydrolase family protein [Opitutaceae bacterium]|jgi:dienelactone hydrolase